MARVKALTLTELIIALSLMGLIMVFPISVELFVRSRYSSLNQKILLTQEASLVLEQIVKQVKQAIGDVSQEALIPYDDGRGFLVRIDDGDGIPNDSDSFVGYRHVGTQIIFYQNGQTPDNPPTSGGEVLTSQALSTDFNQPPSSWGLVVTPDISLRYRFQITVRLRQDPNQPPDPITNPQVELTTQVSTNTPLS